VFSLCLQGEGFFFPGPCQFPELKKARPTRRPVSGRPSRFFLGHSQTWRPLRPALSKALFCLASASRPPGLIVGQNLCPLFRPGLCLCLPGLLLPSGWKPESRSPISSGPASSSGWLVVQSLISSLENANFEPTSWRLPAQFTTPSCHLSLNSS